MSSNESAAYEIMRSLDVDYVLIIFGGVIGYSGDDINKFLWMVRIAEGEHPKDIRVSARPPPGAHAAVKIGVLGFCFFFAQHLLLITALKDGGCLFHFYTFMSPESWRRTA